MIFKIYHPDFPDYTFKLLQVDDAIEDAVNRLGPVKFVSGAYDWPDKTFVFRGWTDKLNALSWPDEGNNFATCVLLIDDARNDLLNQLVEAQKSSVSNWHWPYVILSARMQPAKGLIDGTTDQYFYPAESFPQGGQVTGVLVETPRVEWKMYPLPPINLTSLANTEQFRGLWLLPLVCSRYFRRNTPLNAFVQGSSSSGGGGLEPGYPIIEIDHTKEPTWMPPVLGYPQDAVLPANFVPIANNGVWPDINGSTRFGLAVEPQARMENWRIVNRDVRSAFSVPGGLGVPHSSFTGVIADYPEDWSLLNPQSYHIDACNFRLQPRARLAGGLCDVSSLDELTARKLQFTFRVEGTEAFYCVTIAANVDFPVKVADLVEDTDGPTADEAKIIPLVDLGVVATSRTPSVVEHQQLVVAAKQWALLYYAWRHQQSYMVFPDIYPLIPNGHARVIRWDFSGDERTWRTTYLALEGVQGTDQTYAVTRSPFYARIDGEGAIQDGLHGVYAYTELLDSNGTLTVHPNPRVGYVFNVNGQPQTINPARDEAGKVAVPVGLTVWLKPGVPYLDMTVNKIFDHYLFNTTDLLQIVRLKDVLEINQYGHLGAVIERWNPDTKSFVDSMDIWAVILK